MRNIRTEENVYKYPSFLATQMLTVMFNVQASTPVSIRNILNVSLFKILSMEAIKYHRQTLLETIKWNVKILRNASYFIRGKSHCDTWFGRI